MPRYSSFGVVVMIAKLRSLSPAGDAKSPKGPLTKSAHCRQTNQARSFFLLTGRHNPRYLTHRFPAICPARFSMSSIINRANHM